MDDNATVDNKIESAIRSNYRTAGKIEIVTGLYFRVVDRGLQRLRKRGRIVFVKSSGWAIVPPGEGT
jgi:hypothetical protein